MSSVPLLLNLNALVGTCPEGRAAFLANYAGDSSNTDDNGHHTHCASTAGSKTYGVAKKAKIFAVKVLGASGSVYLTTRYHHFSRFVPSLASLRVSTSLLTTSRTVPGCTSGSVGSPSFGGSKFTAVSSVVANAVTASLFMAVAAGNEGQNAANVSPASEASVFTVAASVANGKFATFSNWGSAVDVIAPGVSILSTWNNGDKCSARCCCSAIACSQRGLANGCNDYNCSYENGLLCTMRCFSSPPSCW